MTFEAPSKPGWIVRYWWVLTLCLFGAIVYIPAIKTRMAALQELKFRVSELEKEKCVALGQKEELALALASQSDPAWIEMVLLREIGVVPEGFLKVHFKR
ncbi:MAG TPA: hypothetical protein VGM34_00975 [Chlamydiales bacterium]|jgi:hypothetical protein